MVFITRRRLGTLHADDDAAVDADADDDYDHAHDEDDDGEKDHADDENNDDDCDPYLDNEARPSQAARWRKCT